jgi:hypothetical protein
MGQGKSRGNGKRGIGELQWESVFAIASDDTALFLKTELEGP